MKKLWKRNAVVGTILVFVCAAIFLNGKYAEKVEQPTKILGQAQQVSGADAAAAETAGTEGTDYFASARLTRQQARGGARAARNGLTASAAASASTTSTTSAS